MWKKSIPGIDERSSLCLNIVRKPQLLLFMPGRPESAFFFHWQSLFRQFSEPLTSRKFSIWLSVLMPLIWSLLRETTMYEEEHQPVLPQLKLLSLEVDPDADITIAFINHSRILPIPFPINQLSCRCIISVGRKQILLKSLPLFRS